MPERCSAIDDVRSFIDRSPQNPLGRQTRLGARFQPHGSRQVDRLDVNQTLVAVGVKGLGTGDFQLRASRLVPVNKTVNAMAKRFILDGSRKVI